MKEFRWPIYGKTETVFLNISFRQKIAAFYPKVGNGKPGKGGAKEVTVLKKNGGFGQTICPNGLATRLVTTILYSSAPFTTRPLKRLFCKRSGDTFQSLKSAFRNTGLHGNVKIVE